MVEALTELQPAPSHPSPPPSRPLARPCSQQCRAICPPTPSDAASLPAGAGTLPKPGPTPKARTGAIVSLSLGGACLMEFRRAGERRALVLPPRSLLIMAGAARLAWAHYIPHHKADRIGGAVQLRRRRVSLTFRQVGCPAGLACAARPGFSWAWGDLLRWGTGGACGRSISIAGQHAGGPAQP